MKRALAVLSMLAFFGCSVDKEIDSEIDIMNIDLVTNVDKCTIYQLDMRSDAVIKVRNYHDYIDITLNRLSSRELKKLSIHFAQSPTGFPMKGVNYDTDHYFYNKEFTGSQQEINLQFKFSELGLQVGDNILVAVIGEFEIKKNKNEQVVARAADLTGNNYYFTYLVEPFAYYAGTDQVREIYLSDAIALPSWDEVRKKYASMLDPGVDRNEGIYKPSITEIIDDFNNPARPTKIGDYPTVYTLGTDGCSDSVLLTLRVIADPL